MIHSKYILFFLLLIINMISGQTFNLSDIEFTISLEKDTFFVDEPLYLEVKEKNISDHKINISNGPFLRVFSMKLYSKLGHEFKWRTGITGDYVSDYKDISYTELLPGESQYYSINLLDGFGNRIDYKGFFSKSLPERTYNLTVTHYTMESWKKNFREQHPKMIPIISNMLTFTIKTPYDYDEKERQAYCLAYQQFWEEDTTQQLNNYFLSYLDSPNYYKYDLLDIAIRYKLRKPDSERAQFNLSMEQMLNEISNSNASFLVSTVLRRYLTDIDKDIKTRNIEHLKKIKMLLINDISDSKLSEYYRMEINKMKNKETN